MSITDLPIPDSYWVIPDRLLAGEYPGIPYMEERTRQRLDAFLGSGINLFLDLTREGETMPYESLLREQAGLYELQVDYRRFPIGDFGLPTVDQMKRILDYIDGGLAQGRGLYVHCFGGVGRTGTTVGCYLVRHGLDGNEALTQLSDWWEGVPKHLQFPRSPETNSQVDFVKNWRE